MASMPQDVLRRDILRTYEIGRFHVAEMYKRSRDEVGHGESGALERVLQFTLVADLAGLGVTKIVSTLCAFYDFGKWF